MKPLGDIVAERPLAQHCEELIGKTHQPRDRKPAIAEFAEEIAIDLADNLRSLLIGARPKISVSEGSTQTAASLDATLSGARLHFAAIEEGEAPNWLFSFEQQTAISLTDRLFGGDGKVEQDSGARAGQSTILAIELIARAMFRAVAKSVPAIHGDCAFESGHRIAQLEPFPRSEYCLNWEVSIDQEGFDPWSFAMVALADDIYKQVDGVASHKCKGNDPGEAARIAPFRDIPMQLTAELAQITLPLARLANLKPGQTIPFAPRRAVPLRIGTKTVAHGSVGTFEDQVALRLTGLN